MTNCTWKMINVPPESEWIVFCHGAYHPNHFGQTKMNLKTNIFHPVTSNRHKYPNTKKHETNKHRINERTRNEPQQPCNKWYIFYTKEHHADICLATSARCIITDATTDTYQNRIVLLSHANWMPLNPTNNGSQASCVCAGVYFMCVKIVVSDNTSSDTSHIQMYKLFSPFHANEMCTRWHK